MLMTSSVEMVTKVHMLVGTVGSMLTCWWFNFLNSQVTHKCALSIEYVCKSLSGHCRQHFCFDDELVRFSETTQHVIQCTEAVPAALRAIAMTK